MRIKSGRVSAYIKVHAGKEPAQRGAKSKVTLSAHMGQAFDLPHVGELLDKQSLHLKRIRNVTEATC